MLMDWEYEADDEDGLEIGEGCRAVGFCRDTGYSIDDWCLPCRVHALYLMLHTGVTKLVMENGDQDIDDLWDEFKRRMVAVFKER